MAAAVLLFMRMTLLRVDGSFCAARPPAGEQDRVVATVESRPVPTGRQEASAVPAPWGGQDGDPDQVLATTLGPQQRVEGPGAGYLQDASGRTPDSDQAQGERMEIIGVIVAGIIIGLLGKLIAPGDKDNIPIWLTIVCGIVGVLVGWFIYSAFGGNGSAGIDWTRWIVSIACAAVLVMIASTLTGRNTSKLSHH
ncbi:MULTISPECIES: GlsB/YeaQ/YmgE family stress response membrane protein [Nocardioides]|nr:MULTISPECIES: GlsB/YeaQ/YmgE family stress response membrane protein [unclassified Nocardioides]